MFLPKAAFPSSMARGLICSFLVHQVPYGVKHSREDRRVYLVRDKVAQTIIASVQCRGHTSPQT